MMMMMMMMMMSRFIRNILMNILQIPKYFKATFIGEERCMTS